MTSAWVVITVILTSSCVLSLNINKSKKEREMVAKIANETRTRSIFPEDQKFMQSIVYVSSKNLKMANNYGPEENDAAPSPAVKVRLVDGGRETEGRVEVSTNGGWSSLCRYSFDVSDALVLCRMIGFDGETPVVRNVSFYRLGQGDIWEKTLQCNGTETSIFDCPQTNIGANDCRHEDDVAVDCQPKHSERSGLSTAESSSDKTAVIAGSVVGAAAALLLAAGAAALIANSAAIKKWRKRGTEQDKCVPTTITSLTAPSGQTPMDTRFPTMGK